LTFTFKTLRPEETLTISTDPNSGESGYTFTNFKTSFSYTILLPDSNTSRSAFVDAEMKTTDLRDAGGVTTIHSTSWPWLKSPE